MGIEAVDLMLMSPRAHHLSAEDIAATEADAYPPKVTVSVLASAYRAAPREPDPGTQVSRRAR